MLFSGLDSGCLLLGSWLGFWAMFFMCLGKNIALALWFWFISLPRTLRYA